MIAFLISEFRIMMGVTAIEVSGRHMGLGRSLTASTLISKYLGCVRDVLKRSLSTNTQKIKQLIRN